MDRVYFVARYAVTDQNISGSIGQRDECIDGIANPAKNRGSACECSAFQRPQPACAPGADAVDAIGPVASLAQFSAAGQQHERGTEKPVIVNRHYRWHAESLRCEYRREATKMKIMKMHNVGLLLFDDARQRSRTERIGR